MNEIDREVDREMRGVLGELAPSAGFEEELLSVIRERTMHKRIRPVMRIAGKAIAAAVALAATGVAADVMIHQDAGNNAVTKRLVAVG
ncbi:MAG: hypothetical protein FWD61_17520, partial [Phycisphaerales bacterium]|nr:hypothetical protein [Phycisphaerales bacterium]